MTKIVIKKCCKSASELLDCLAIGTPDSEYPRESCLYRGVGIGSGPSEYKLVPSALRLGQDYKDFKKLMQLTRTSGEPVECHSQWEVTQSRMESVILSSFFRFADAEGLPMPERVACIAVWMLCEDILEAMRPLYDVTVSGFDGHPQTLPLKIVTASASTNPNLRAQRGVFTVWRPKLTNGHKQQVEREPLDKLLAIAFKDRSSTQTLLYKYSLPLKHVPELWDILQRNGIHAARLFPDFRGAADAVIERTKY